MYVKGQPMGPDTVDTLPRETLEAFRDHGALRHSVEDNLEDAEFTLRTLAEQGIDYQAVTAQLEQEGVEKFAQSFDKLLDGIAEKREKLAAGAVGSRVAGSGRWSW